MEKFKIISKNNFENLPKSAGVYAFYEKSKKSSKIINAKRYTPNPIYIGKAINIKSRVQNHFNQPSWRDNLFMDKVEKIGFMETGSEISALILEASLIKKFLPKYNVVWKDDKNYFYVAIAYNKEKIPYIFITHQPNSLNHNVIPAKAGIQLRANNPRFPIKLGMTTETGLPRRLRAPRNDNTYYIGPFTDGNSLKKTIRFLRKIFPYYTSSKHSKLKCQWCHLDLCPGPKLFEDPPSHEASAGLYAYRKNIKKLILILEGKSKTVLNSLKKEMKLASASQNFETASKIRDKIFALERVMSHKIVRDPTSHNFNGWENTQKVLQDILNIENNINRIECYDISNIQGKFAVGSMIVFVKGTPDKSQYKKFKIKMENKPNDIAMLKEVLQRRLLHTEWQYPEVILMDGGKAQLNAAIEIKNKLLATNYKLQTLKIIAIAKGRQELFIEDKENPIPLKALPQEIYNLIKNLDDQAHRFAITYHKKLRKENLLK